MDTQSAPPPPAESRSAATAADDTQDVHSYAKPGDARVTHVALDLRADFAAKTLAGTATLSLQIAPGATHVVLDTQDLEITKVTGAGGKDLKFALGATDKILGRPLTIDVTPDDKRIVISYRTSPQAAALQWLAPSQTAGKQQPYLFSQGEAILTRSWIPTQDSPGIRQSYEARITVPKGLRAVMSAEQLTPDGVLLSGAAEGDGSRRFDFRLTQPIPSYLIAIAIGDLAFKPIGARTGVYAEPSVVNAAASEFADLEKMVEAAESIGGPYRWGRYDVLVLPPSFPFGGMENPRLTFATPTVLAGDRSLTSLLAHELAHSWSGNLVTNGTWNDFWLNEGFTVYFELRIMEALYGKEREAMLDVLNRQELQEEVERLGPTSADTQLHLDLKGRNPDDGMTTIAYNKGAAFLHVVEAAVGRERFDPYLRGYFDRHAFTPMTTSAFLADLRANLLKGDKALEAKLKIDEWVYRPGVPDNATRPVSDAFTRVDAQIAAFAKGAAATSLDTHGWITQQWQHFLNNLPKTLTGAQVADLDKAFHFTAQHNSEILFSWLRIAIRQHYRPAMPALDTFLTSQGRRKFLKPLYEDLMATEWGKPEAKRIYRHARPLYHSVATSTLDEIVK
jgi:aminopeptidase N